MERLPEHGPCFVCGAENPRSIGVTWYLCPDGRVECEITFTLQHQGPPGHAHGGATTAVLDEAMGAAVWHAGVKGLAAKLTVEFHRLVPLGVPVAVVGRLLEKDGRKVRASAEARLPGGEIAVSAVGLFVEAKHLLDGDIQDKQWIPAPD